jgi:glycolate oxidase iron-sulfur subunit
VNTAPAPFLDSRKSLACIHCGLCLSSCPTYLETGDENNSPRGRIYLMRAIQEGRIPVPRIAPEPIDLCLGCRACETACPSGVPYGALLESTRDYLEKQVRRSPFQRFLRLIVIEKVFPFPSRMKLALLPAIWTRRLGLEKFLPKFLREPLQLIPTTSSSEPVPELSPAKAPAKGRVGFIPGCVMSVLFGQTHASSVRLINRAGYDVINPRRQGCCGALYSHGGNLKQARAAARVNIAAFEHLELESIIINAAGCGSTLKEYGHLLEHDAAWAVRAKMFSAKVKDLTEWLIEHASDLPRSKEQRRVTFHDACHLAHAQKITKPPRDLVRAIAGENYVELPEADLCCGSAGSYNLTEPEMAGRLQRRKSDNILRTGAEIVVTTNPGCILQMEAGLRKAGASKIKVMHIADFLAMHLD